MVSKDFGVADSVAAGWETSVRFSASKMVTVGGALVQLEWGYKCWPVNFFFLLGHATQQLGS